MDTEEFYTGLKRDSPDPRDLTRMYGGHEIPSSEEHPKIDLRRYIHHVYNQGRLQSCTANVLCAAYTVGLNVQAARTKGSSLYFDPSRLFVFFNSHMYDGTPGGKTSVALRDALKAIRDLGVCRESLWPYNIQNYATRPTGDSYDDAEGNNIVKFERLAQDIHQFRACLKNKHPIAFGMEIYKSFYSPENKSKGLMPMPTPEEIKSGKYSLHGVLAVGYDDTTRRITVLNSWGDSFGDKGYFYMPYDFITAPNRACDFWKIEKVSRKE